MGHSVPWTTNRWSRICMAWDSSFSKLSFLTSGLLFVWSFKNGLYSLCSQNHKICLVHLVSNWFSNILFIFSLYITHWSLGFYYFTGFSHLWYMLNAISFIWFFKNLYSLCRIRQFLIWNFMQLNLFCMPDLYFLLLLAFAHSIISVSLVCLTIPYLVSSRNFINVHLLPDC